MSVELPSRIATRGISEPVGDPCVKRQLQAIARDLHINDDDGFTLELLGGNKASGSYLSRLVRAHPGVMWRMTTRTFPAPSVACKYV